MPQPADVSRREFLTTLSAGAAGLAAATVVGMNSPAVGANALPNHRPKRVTRKFAPHLGMFRNLAGDDPVDQIRFMAEQGFTAMEDIGFAGRPLEEQRLISDALDRHGMRLSLFVGAAHFGCPTFGTATRAGMSQIRTPLLQALRSAKLANAAGFIVVPGQRDSQLSEAEQFANAVRRLKECAGWCAEAGRMMYLEPLNHLGSSPQMFLHSIDQAAEICRAVGNDSCKVLFDVYHQSVIGADVFDLIERNWDQIGYFQIGDYPGRKEPGTGTFDFARFFALAGARDYAGYFGMEHGNALPGREGELAVLEAYRRLETIG